MATNTENNLLSKNTDYAYTYSYSTGEPNAVWDHFEMTPPMSTFTLGLVIAELSQIGDSKRLRNENDGVVSNIGKLKHRLINIISYSNRR